MILDAFVSQNTPGGDLDRRSKVPSGQMTGIRLEKAEYRIGARNIQSDEDGIGKEFVIEAGLMAMAGSVKAVDFPITGRLFYL